MNNTIEQQIAYLRRTANKLENLTINVASNPGTPSLVEVTIGNTATQFPNVPCTGFYISNINSTNVNDFIAIGDSSITVNKGISIYKTDYTYIGATNANEWYGIGTTAGDKITLIIMS